LVYCVSIFVCLRVLFTLFIFFFDPLIIQECCWIFMCLWVSQFSSCLIFSFILLGLRKFFGMISIFLNLLRLILWPNIWSILENVQFLFDKNVYFAAVRKNVLYMSIRQVWPIVFKSEISLLILCLDDLPIVENGILKSPIIIVLLFTSSFSSFSICFIY